MVAVGATFAWTGPFAAAVALAVSLIVVVAYRLGVWALPLILLVGLLAMSYGFNNIAFAGVPAVLPALILAVAILSRRWWPGIRGAKLSYFVAAYSILLILVTFRLFIDFRTYGVLAIRDALFLVDVAALLIGFSIASSGFFTDRHTTIICWVLLIWTSTYFFRNYVESLSPTVGVQHTATLFDYTLAGVVSVVLFFHFSSKPGFLSAIASFVCIALIVITQFKGAYVATAALMTLLLVVGVLQSRVQVFIRPVTMIILGTVLSAMLLPLAGLEGRVADASLASAVRQIEGLVDPSSSGIGQESVEARRSWAPLVLRSVADAPFGEIVGAGLGVDLVEGFTTESGEPVRKPHNDYLEAYGRSGIIGFACFTFLVAYGIFCSFANWFKSLERRWLTVFSLQFTLALTALVQPTFAFSYGGVPFFMMTGIAVAYRVSSKKGGTRLPQIYLLERPERNTAR